MAVVHATTREITLPAEVLRLLRRALRKEAGPLASIHSLHNAGYAAGESFYLKLCEEAGGELSELSEREFWSHLNRFFRGWGWGDLTQERAHPGLGVLHADDWGESNPNGGESQPGCAFTAGLLVHLLGKVAGSPIAVLEVACRTRGDDHCSFLFGSEQAIHDVYGLLLEGDSLDEALENL
jgi:predicted hydrocarbon binding protein